MKTIIVITLSIITFLSSEITFSQEKELEVKFLKKSGKKVKMDILEDDSYQDVMGEDEYSLESIVFVNWNGLHGLKVTKRNESEDTDELVFYSMGIQGDYIKKKKSGEYVFTIKLQQFNLSCCGDFTFQVIDSYSKELVKEFKVSQTHNGE